MRPAAVSLSAQPSLPTVADGNAVRCSDGNTTGADGTDYCSNDGAPCSSKPADLDHGVLVVGYGAFAAKDGKDWDVFYVRATTTRLGLGSLSLSSALCFVVRSTEVHFGFAS